MSNANSKYSTGYTTKSLLDVDFLDPVKCGKDNRFYFLHVDEPDDFNPSGKYGFTEKQLGIVARGVGLTDVDDLFDLMFLAGDTAKVKVKYVYVQVGDERPNQPGVIHGMDAEGNQLPDAKDWFIPETVRLIIPNDIRDRFRRSNPNVARKRRADVNAIASSIESDVAIVGLDQELP